MVAAQNDDLGENLGTYQGTPSCNYLIVCSNLFAIGAQSMISHCA